MKDTKTFILRDSGIRDLCKTYMDMQNLADRLLEVVVRPYEENRRRAQQALMWIWHEQWSKHFGDSVNEEHIRFKRYYLLPILLREQKMQNLDALYELAQEKVRVSQDFGPLNAIYEMISTNWLSVKEFAEMLTSYQQETATLGLVFITKSKRYEDAFPSRPDRGVIR